ncbi:hypothetical protein EMIHUDRAFT_370254 [Emiliania huxleyi CCMP1516]|uniref:Sugar phosphate transporter domain-containing protein n=2 Tax=Emiliania huxleyi TaxID=2903 RepID=A0A0D3IZH7_EMIH1|nr:hypothetical protein EMIHUDRAFT_370254 [Emiliania huxleyi CCMP1516]EOD16662.1 hypothetical protein EMIHUDRAFT_370254 [Emiliania huxleyi CCMP1516]|eukprot:XP_005769091.1 hypothetical protein EMIHUDRAFT_370254 [Emiliania huxleyi CCMP1516]
MSALVAQAGSLALNLVSGVGVVLANKLVFTTARFSFPTALTACHYATNFLLLLCLDVVRPSAESRRGGGAEPLDRQLMFLTAVWAFHNALSNLSLSRNSVGLYQVSKILVTPLIVALEYAVYRRLPHARLALPLLGACLGVALATVSDVSFEVRGALTAAASACASALLKVLQQDVLQRRDWSSLELMRRTWGPQTLLLVLSVPLLDARADRLPQYEPTAERVGILLLSCAAAFALNVSALYAIKLTSAIAIVLLSQGKTAVTLLGGYLFFDGQPNVRQLGGATIAVLSLGTYSYLSATLGGVAGAAPSSQRGEDPPTEAESAREQQQPLKGGDA